MRLCNCRIRWLVCTAAILAVCLPPWSDALAASDAGHVLKLIQVTHTGPGVGTFEAHIRVSATDSPGFFEIVSMSGSSLAPRVEATPFTHFGAGSDVAVAGQDLGNVSCGWNVMCRTYFSGDDQLVSGIVATGTGWFRLLVVAEGDRIRFTVNKSSHVSITNRSGGFQRLTFRTATVSTGATTFQAMGTLATAGTSDGSVAVAELPCFGAPNSGVGTGQLSDSAGASVGVDCGMPKPATLYAPHRPRFELRGTGAWWGTVRTNLLVLPFR